MSDARRTILHRVSQALQERPPRPEPYRPPAGHPPVTQIVGGREAWLERFGQELTRLGGDWDYAESIAAARLRLLSRLQEQGVRRILAWDPDRWPLPGLYEALTTIGIEILAPDLRAGDREEMLQQAAGLDIGLTGAEAAIANTGTLILRSGPGFSRLASLITPWHLALVPMSRLYPNLEAWLADLRATGWDREYFMGTSKVIFISGPSRTADIEMTLTLGVHGPRHVEVLFFEER
ncbi:MAG TPA: LUD domain-containing protein [Caldilineae bacterium]|nr:LUD domain-containing protein [Caldilineae bacterium]